MGDFNFYLNSRLHLTFSKLMRDFKSYYGQLKLELLPTFSKLMRTFNSYQLDFNWSIKPELKPFKLQIAKFKAYGAYNLDWIIHTCVRRIDIFISLRV